MRASDAHVNNPLRVTKLDVDRAGFFNSEKRWKNMETISQEVYDSMGVHDVNTIYVINRDDSIDFYLGDELVEHRTTDMAGPQYLMSLSPDHTKFSIYEQVFDTFLSAYKLVEIAQYDDPQAAIDRLYRYNRAGSYTLLANKISAVLAAYIEENMGINEAIIHIIISSGVPSNDQELQELITFNNAFGIKSSDRDISENLKFGLHGALHPMLQLYERIYNIFVLYNFFSDKSYKTLPIDRVDLSGPTQKIMALFE